MRSFTWDYVREGESEGGSVSAGVERVLLDPDDVSLNSGNSSFILRERKKDCSRRCQYIQSFDFFLHFDIQFDTSAILFGNDASIRLNIRINISLALLKKQDRPRRCQYIQSFDIFFQF